MLPGLLHPLQQNLDESFLLCAISREFMTIASEFVELAVRSKMLNLRLWVAAVIHEVEQVNEDGFQGLCFCQLRP